MKFLCSNCKAKYQIADEKVAGRTLRMTCRRCQQEIVIRGDTSQPGYGHIGAGPPLVAAPPPSPLGADFHAPSAANPYSSMPSAKAAEEWHVAINDVPVGPMRRDEVARKLASGLIDGESLAWREGMDDWHALHTIPELASLLGRNASLPPPPPGPPPLHTAQGRASATPYTIDSWVPSESPSQMLPMHESLPTERRSSALPSGPVMFALACGFAFLMSALTIYGARWLRDSPTAAPTEPAQPGAAGAVAAAKPVEPVLELPPEEAEEQPEGMVIALDDVEGREPANSRSRGAGTAPAKSGKKELTAAQKEMLARMGGDTGTDLSRLGTGSADTGRGKRPAGALTAQEVSRVVLRGKKNLQRCYETALRGSGLDQTVRMDVELTVSPNGNVTQVKTGGSNLPGMSQCIQRTVKMWRFPASGESSPVKFPLLFQPGA